ncbi:MAG TPA: glycerate kinase [Jatrophihabitans sp.]|uniref:glycerate kinase n=1 Tax=Jatrophihabitans sp. TaxID=1932789 RepID=UPI002EF71DE0
MLIAPDKFKGSLEAPAAAAALAQGWHSVRPGDELAVLPMADGGDGTLAVLAAGRPASWVTVPTVDAVGNPRLGRYLRAGDTAAVELAEICGIAGLSKLDPMGSHTLGLGIVLAAALRSGARGLVVALGGSASTDGGAGALSALGARLVGEDGRLPPGGRGLTRLVAVRADRLAPVPPDGVRVLVDVQAPLFGPSGGAFAFGPQKGADREEMLELDRGLRRLAAVLGTDPDQPGCGAAGGTGYGLAYWGGRLTPGAPTIGQLVGLPEAVRRADLVLTGEGRFDASSLTGKTCGHVLETAARSGVPALVVAGSIADEMATAAAGTGLLSLTELAGSALAAQQDPVRWLAEAGRQAAEATTR